MKGVANKTHCPFPPDGVDLAGDGLYARVGETLLLFEATPDELVRLGIRLVQQSFELRAKLAAPATPEAKH